MPASIWSSGQSSSMGICPDSARAMSSSWRTSADISSFFSSMRSSASSFSAMDARDSANSHCVAMALSGVRSSWATSEVKRCSR